MEHNKKERDIIFAKFKWEGIVQYNRLHATLDKPKCQSEKKAENMKELTRCRYCNITGVKTDFSRNQIKCKHITTEPVVSIPLAFASNVKTIMVPVAYFKATSWKQFNLKKHR